MSVNLALVIVRLVSSKQLRTYGMTQNRRRNQCNFLVWNSWLRSSIILSTETNSAIQTTSNNLSSELTAAAAAHP